MRAEAIVFPQDPRIPWSHPVLAPVSRSCPGPGGRLPTRYSPVRHSCTPEGALPFDLHVLSTPPAFVLSQDQTLRFEPCADATRSRASRPVVRKRSARRTASSAIDGKYESGRPIGLPEPERTARYSVFKDRPKPPPLPVPGRGGEGQPGATPWFASHLLREMHSTEPATPGQGAAGSPPGATGGSRGSAAQPISARAKRRFPARIR